MNIEQLRQRIKTDWQGTPQEEICLGILDYLTSSACEPEEKIYFCLIDRLFLTDRLYGSRPRFSKAEILKALQYFCGDRVPLLNVGFELIEGSESYPLTHQNLRIALQSGLLEHPVTGAMVSGFEENVFIYFLPSELSQRIHRQQRSRDDSTH